MDLEKENPGELSQSTGLSSLEATPSHPKQPKRVKIEEEPRTEDKAALVREEDPEDQQQQPPRPKRPVLDQPVISLQGREVLFAIAIFFLLAVVVSLLVIYITTLTKMRQLDHDNKTANAELSQTQRALEKKSMQLTEMNNKLNQTAEAAAKTAEAAKTALAALEAAEETNERLEDQVFGLSRDVNRTCRDPRCLRAAVDLLDKMDLDVDPCEDFWEFSCGTWIAEAEIPDSREAWGLDTERERVFMEKIRKDLNSSKRMGVYDPVEEKYKTLFNVCMKTVDEEEAGVFGGDNPLSKILSRWNICPQHKGRRSRSSCMTRQGMMESLHFDYGIDSLFDLKIVKDDDDNASIAYIKIDHASLGHLSKQHSLHHKSSSSYENYIEETIAAVDKRVKADIFSRSVLSVEKELISTLKDERKYKRRGEFGHSPSIVSVEELQRISLPKEDFDWLKFLQKISTEFQSHWKVAIVSRTYVENISSLLKSTNNRDLENFLRWRLVIHLAPFLSTSLKHRQTVFLNSHRKVGIKTTEMKRQRYCQDIVIERFPFALLASVASHDQKINAKRENVKDMALKIQSALVESLTGVDWMDNDTVARAQSRLNATKIEIGFPEFVLNETEVDRYYGAMNVSEGNSFFQNVITTMKHKYEILKLRLTDPKEIFDQGWETNHFQPNVFFSPDDNLIGVTYCLLQKPFYDEDRYSFLNYASLGWKIAHEMISAMFDSDDNQDLVQDWWSNETSLNFVNRSQCLKDYHMELVRKPDEKVVGKMSFREYIADIGGLFHSYKAYKEWEDENGEESLLPGLNLSNDQAFFVGFAQNLCKRRRKNEKKRSVGHRFPPAEEIRVQGTLSMFHVFKEVYACQNTTQRKDFTVTPQCERLLW